MILGNADRQFLPACAGGLVEIAHVPLIPFQQLEVRDFLVALRLLRLPLLGQHLLREPLPLALQRASQAAEILVQFRARLHLGLLAAASSDTSPRTPCSCSPGRARSPQAGSCCAASLTIIFASTSRFKRTWISAWCCGLTPESGCGSLLWAARSASASLISLDKLLALLRDFLGGKPAIDDPVHQIVDPARQFAAENNVGTDAAKLLAALAWRQFARRRPGAAGGRLSALWRSLSPGPGRRTRRIQRPGGRPGYIPGSAAGKRRVTLRWRRHDAAVAAVGRPAIILGQSPAAPCPTRPQSPPTLPTARLVLARKLPRK